MVNVLEAIVAYTLFSVLLILMIVACIGRFLGWSDPSAPSKYAVKKAALKSQDGLYSDNDSTSVGGNNNNNNNNDNNNDNVELVIKNDIPESEEKENTEKSATTNTNRRVDSFGKEGEISSNVRSPSNESNVSSSSMSQPNESQLIASPMKENEMSETLTNDDKEPTKETKVNDGNKYIALDEDEGVNNDISTAASEGGKGDGGDEQGQSSTSSAASMDSTMTTGTDGVKKKRVKPKARTKKTDSSKVTSLDTSQVVESI
jgi:hypothetical protein